MAASMLKVATDRSFFFLLVLLFLFLFGGFLLSLYSFWPILNLGCFTGRLELLLLALALRACRSSLADTVLSLSLLLRDVACLNLFVWLLCWVQWLLLDWLVTFHVLTVSRRLA